MVKKTVPPKRLPVTTEELKLLATPDKELEREAFVSSFDEERFEQRIKQGESWQQLIQAHLYYDHVITQILKDALVYPEEAGLSYLGSLRSSA